MRKEFTAVIKRDGNWFIAYCPEIPGANGQGRTIEECRSSLADAIALILQHRSELERRLMESVACPAAVTPWEVVKARALARARR